MSEPATNEGKQDMAILQKHVDALREHFDSVQILVTRHEPNQDGTININLGAGNWFTRYGHARDWLIRVDEQTRMDRRKEQDE